MFVAVAGSRTDGHAFVHEAIASGASAIVCERPLDVDVPQCLVPDSREALGQICQALAGHPSRTLKVIGITGTNGKTTTAHLIASILHEAGCRAGTLGTLGYFDSQDFAPAPLTTPDARSLAAWLGRMVAAAARTP